MSNFHFIEEDLSLFTLTYLLGGRGGGELNLFLVCKSKFKSLELESQLRLIMLSGSLFIWLQCGNAIPEGHSELKIKLALFPCFFLKDFFAYD